MSESIVKRAAVFDCASSSLASISLAVDCPIECSRPVGVDKRLVKRELAVTWLHEQSRHLSFWQRVRLLWELAREVFAR